MRALIAILAMPLLVGCAGMNGAAGRDPSGPRYLLPPAPQIERAQTTELAALPEGGAAAVPAAAER